jgi:hypothetical protein
MSRGTPRRTASDLGPGAATSSVAAARAALAALAVHGAHASAELKKLTAGQFQTYVAVVTYA